MDIKNKKHVSCVKQSFRPSSFTVAAIAAKVFLITDYSLILPKVIRESVPFLLYLFVQISHELHNMI